MLGTIQTEEVQMYFDVCAVSFVSASIRRPRKGVDFLPSSLAANVSSFFFFFVLMLFQLYQL